MLVFPNCKINLGLKILRRRKDGFHDLETVFYPLPFQDVLEIIPHKDSAASPDIHFSLSGLEIEARENENICIKAYSLLKGKFTQIPSCQLHLHKMIPTGAGLGGGSADAAFTMKVLNEIGLLNLTQKELIEISLQLGSDCPFFIINKPCFAQGRGEQLEEITLDLSSYKFVVVKPDYGVNTREAFSGIRPSLPEVSIREIINKPVETWRSELRNDFEQTIFLQYPGLEKIKNVLYDAGAVYASMSGSGSAVYGIFSKEKSTVLNFPSQYFIKEIPC